MALLLGTTLAPATTVARRWFRSSEDLPANWARVSNTKKFSISPPSRSPVLLQVLDSSSQYDSSPKRSPSAAQRRNESFCRRAAARQNDPDEP
jgi:hypothetical protein